MRWWLEIVIDFRFCSYLVIKFFLLSICHWTDETVHIGLLWPVTAGHKGKMWTISIGQGQWHNENKFSD